MIKNESQSKSSHSYYFTSICITSPFLFYLTYIITLEILLVCGVIAGNGIAEMYDLYRISSYAMIP